MLRRHGLHQLVDGDVEIGAVLQRPGNDERRARLVDQDRIDLVDDGEDVSALDHLLLVDLHVVAQVVEAELVVGAVGHVAGVLRLALLVVEVVHDATDSEAQELVDLAHPLRVALSQIIVDGDDMHACASERVEIDRQRGDQCLTLARLHLRDLALVQHHAADELNVEVALAERALGRLTHGCECGNEQVVKRRALLDLAAEILRARPQLRVAQSRDLGLERIDRLHARPVALDAALVGGAEDLCRKAADSGEHQNVSLNLPTCRRRTRAPSGERRPRNIAAVSAGGCLKGPP